MYIDDDDDDDDDDGSKPSQIQKSVVRNDLFDYNTSCKVFTMKIINLLSIEFNDYFVKACQRLLSQEPPSSL